MPEHQVRPALLTIQAKIGAVSVVALLAVAFPEEAMAQSGGAQSAQGATPLPTVSVDITGPRRKPRRAATAPRQRIAAPPQPQPQLQAAPTQASRSGTVGYVTTRTTTGTKTDTPIINIPQSISVVTQQFLRDQNNQSFLETLRYVPGVIPHQGEGNRDDVVIRGQRSNADFFVNGVRDDVQYFRDVYNVQRIEVLKGPNAMIFGRGGGGGVVNRVLKDATGTPVREVILQGGQYFNKRVAVDVGDRVSDSVFFRLNGMFEDSGTYRDYVDLQRWGINPTATILLGP